MTNCPNCQTQFVKPLEDFAGKWYCPSCHKELFPNEETKLCITAESNGYFVRSERLFKQGYLLKKEVMGYRPSEALDEAVKQCQFAAALNDPYATVSLAAYYENGHAEGRGSDIKRWNMALRLYLAVCHNNNSFSIDNGTGKPVPMSEAEMTAIRFEAGVGILRLLKNVPAAYPLAKNRQFLSGVENDTRKYLKEVIKTHAFKDDKSAIFFEYKKLPEKIISEDSEKAQEQEFTAIDFSNNISRMAKQERCALMFVAYMSGTEVEALKENIQVAALKATGKSKPLYRFCRDNKIEIYGVPCFARKKEPNGLFANLFAQDFEYDPKPEKMYLFFVINTSPAANRKLKAKNLKEALMCDDQEQLRRLVMLNIQNDYIFHEDDIILMGEQNANKVVSKLIDKINATV